MAKATAKTSAKATAVKKAAPKKTAAKKTSSSTSSLEKTSEEVLKKLKSLDLDHQLQSDLEWCIGSFKHDKNPVGLIESLERALIVFKDALVKKTKGVTAKTITDIGKVLK